MFEKVIGGEEVGGPGDQILLDLQQLGPASQKHLNTQRQVVNQSLQVGVDAASGPTLSPKCR